MKWDVDKADAVLWIATEAAKSLCGSMKSKCGIMFNEHLVAVEDGHRFRWCLLESENESIGNFLVNKFKNSKFRTKFDKDHRQFYRKAVKKLDSIDNKDFSKINNKGLFKALKDSNDLYVHNFDWGFISEPMDYVMPRMFETRLIKFGYTTQEISDMIAIADISFMNRETQELINIGLKPKSKRQEALKKHAYKYRWLHSAHMGRIDIPISYFQERLDELRKKGLKQELKKLKNFKNDLKRRKMEIMKKKPVDNETKTLFEIADVVGPLHDVRKELFMRSAYTVDTARAEVARRYGYTKDELAVFEVKDILKLEKGQKIDKGYANELIKDSLLYINVKKNIWKVYAGKEAKDIMDKELAFTDEGITEFRGMPASLGKAQGRVKIINGTKEMGKMQEGDVIVSSMTKPEFVVAIKKAVAIVTDEGGVTCHAAIVSRELGIPCIIGTKIATNVLKDGDLIEVDANNGVVRRL